MSSRRTIASFRRDTARRLRANPTDAELRLWRELRRLPMFGSHFRRQVPIGPYVADFACMAARLVVEVDGSQHGDGRNQERDAERTAYLEREGYRVIRFWNNDLTNNMRGVLEAIHAALHGVTGHGLVPLEHQRRVRDD